MAPSGGTCGVERDLLARLFGVCHMSFECCLFIAVESIKTGALLNDQCRLLLERCAKRQQFVYVKIAVVTCPLTTKNQTAPRASYEQSTFAPATRSLPLPKNHSPRNLLRACVRASVCYGRCILFAEVAYNNRLPPLRLPPPIGRVVVIGIDRWRVYIRNKPCSAHKFECTIHLPEGLLVVSIRRIILQLEQLLVL